MENKNKRNGLITGVVLAGALTAFSVSSVQARPATSRVLGNGSELRSELIDLNIVSSPNSLYEMKCGSKETPKKEKSEKKTTEAKCGAAKKKAGEAKCGASKKKATEAKCGANKTKSAKKADTTKAKPTKSPEGKCGQGKCGGSN